MTEGDMQTVSTDRLFRDLDALAADVEELITSTAGNATEAIAEARARIEISLRNAKRILENARLCPLEEANDAREVKATYFRVNAWKAIGVAGGIGLLLGLITGLKGGLSRTQRDGSK
jgi:ElaB/YqjD/DUF883 family membrane-anchored ribosome-binding protein